MILLAIGARLGADKWTSSGLCLAGMLWHASCLVEVDLCNWGFVLWRPLCQACGRPGTNKLFVGGLPQNTAAAELREHFEVHVPATQITVCLPGVHMLRAQNQMSAT